MISIVITIIFFLAGIFHCKKKLKKLVTETNSLSETEVAKKEWVKQREKNIVHFIKWNLYIKSIASVLCLRLDPLRLSTIVVQIWFERLWLNNAYPSLFFLVVRNLSNRTKLLAILCYLFFILEIAIFAEWNYVIWRVYLLFSAWKSASKPR